MGMRLENKVAMVTGGAGGIGRVICRTLAMEGALVAVVDIDLEKATGVAEEIEMAGGTAKPFFCDISRWDQAKGAVGKILDRFERVDILVNNAGVWGPLTFAESTPEDWEQQIRINYYGTLHCTRAVLGPMIQQQNGRIISIISDAGRCGVSGFSIYGSTKAAINIFTKALSYEVGNHRITVNTVSPGIIEAENSFKDIEHLGRQRLLSETSLGRLGQPQDVANAVLFLASKEADFITGETLSVNGGRGTF
jgi:2-hydroxycyclohexanecarboxyl-CoA dehydrogenase